MIERRQEKNKKLEENLRKEETNEKRILLGKKILKIVLIIILLITLFFMYMHFIGTKGLVVREYKVSSNKLPDSYHGFKIVHFSDLHYLTTVKDKEMKSIVNKINELNPDMVVFTGDLIDKDKDISNKQIKKLANYLNSINAKLGVYAIKGDEDYNDKYNEVISQTNIRLINNSYEVLHFNNSYPIILNGTGSIIKKDCDLNQTFNFNNEEDLFVITLVHEADITDDILKNYKSDLILAGHSNNGQIRLPFIGGLVKFDYGKKYTNKKYNLDDTTLFVSGGLGTSKFEFRLFNHPSINLYRLVKETN